MTVAAAAAVRAENGRCPAVTIDVAVTEPAAARARRRCHGGVSACSIDIVPAVRLLDWPTPARQWSSSWLPTTVTAKIRDPATNNHLQPCLVPKIHDTGRLTYLSVAKVTFAMS